nr:hypothetical protein Iba_chr11aCG13910 [Ipomoea batatas]
MQHQRRLRRQPEKEFQRRQGFSDGVAGWWNRAAPTSFFSLHLAAEHHGGMDLTADVLHSISSSGNGRGERLPLLRAVCEQSTGDLLADVFSFISVAAFHFSGGVGQGMKVTVVTGAATTMEATFNQTSLTLHLCSNPQPPASISADSPCFARLSWTSATCKAATDFVPPPVLACGSGSRCDLRWHDTAVAVGSSPIDGELLPAAARDELPSS